VSQLTGRWVSPEGAGTITFYADHRFTATSFDLNGVMGLPCQPAPSDSGVWEFLPADQHSVPDLSEYSTGDIIFLYDDGNADSANSCLDMSTLTTWQINGPLGLCPEGDPDSPCVGEPWVWVKAAPTAQRIPLPSYIDRIIRNL
jgi:hypothetical protein